MALQVLKVALDLLAVLAGGAVWNGRRLPDDADPPAKVSQPIIIAIASNEEVFPTACVALDTRINSLHGALPQLLWKLTRAIEIIILEIDFVRLWKHAEVGIL